MVMLVILLTGLALFLVKIILPKTAV